jgi:hypothetical protein
LSKPIAAAVTLVAAMAAGLVALTLTAAGREQHVVWSAGLQPVADGRTLRPRASVCQPFVLPDQADAVAMPVHVRGSGQPLEVLVRDTAGGRVLTRGSTPGQYRSGDAVTVRLGAIPSGSALEVCVRNMGTARVDVLGESKTMDISFLRTAPRSTLDLLGDAFRRASVFRPEWVGAWTFWLLLGFIGIGAPTALALALACAEREDLTRDDLDPVGTPRA